MIIYPAAMSNAERQRQFRAAHPGYFKRYNARRSALMRQAKKRTAAEFAALAQAEAQANAAPSTDAMASTIAPPAPFAALPAAA